MKTKSSPRFSLIKLFFFSLLFLCCSVPLSFAQPVSKEEVLKKYEKAVYLAEELNVYQEDVLQVVPKIQLAVKALLRNDFEQSDRVLTEALQDLTWIESQRPGRSQRVFQLKWLQIYQDIIQKFAVLALLAFIWIRIPYFKRQLLKGRLTAIARIYFILLAGFFAVLFSFLDLARYGESAWAFMDVQVILVTAGGLLGGLVPGICLGLLAGAFRLILNLNFFNYFMIALAAGILGGLASLLVRDYKKIKLLSLVAGLGVGTLHGLIIYGRMFGSGSWPYAVFSIVFVAVLEGAAVFIMGAIIAGQLQEENRREMEKELLRTKLNFLQAQINPHFLYNALNTISAVCSQENALKAKELILRLAEFFRATLKRAEDSVTLREEMAHLDAYLAIEKMRFQNRLQAEKKLILSDAAWATRIPFLILQPLVENAIKHGISKKTEGGKVEIFAEEKEGKIIFEIRDNGAGMKPQTIQDILNGKIEPENGNGIGVQNVNHRLQSWTSLKMPMQFISEPGKGTTVRLEIPVKK